MYLLDPNFWLWMVEEPSHIPAKMKDIVKNNLRLHQTVRQLTRNEPVTVIVKGGAHDALDHCRSSHFSNRFWISTPSPY